MPGREPLAVTPRERVLAAIDHGTPDRVPLDLGGSTVTALHWSVYDGLKALLGVEAGTSIVNEISQMPTLPPSDRSTMYPAPTSSTV